MARKRDEQVVALRSKGRSPSKIAVDLGVTEGRVNSVLRRLVRECGVTHEWIKGRCSHCATRQPKGENIGKSNSIKKHPGHKAQVQQTVNDFRKAVENIKR